MPVWHLEGGLRSGCSIVVTGTPTEDSHRFVINLKSGPGENDEIVFHFNPRFTENQVVRNSCIRGVGWGCEERYGGFPFGRGSCFEVTILVQPDTFKVSINGLDFCEYKHRVPLNSVSHLEIVHRVRVDRVSINLEWTTAEQVV